MKTLSKLGPRFGICLLALGCYAWAQTPGNIATFAGNGYYRPTGNPTSDGSQATNVALETPSAVAVDALGNLYIADKNDNRVRKVGTNSVITTVAGNGTAGFSGDSGPAANAQLDSPVGVAVDNTVGTPTSGTIYIVDSVNNLIRKVDTSGHISTFAGNGTSPPATPTHNDPIGDGGPATSASLYNPSSVAVDASGNVYITDQYHRIVRKVNPSGTLITTVAGVENTRGFSGDGGQATSAQLDSPAGVAVDASGNLYIADQYNYRIRKVNNTTGVITTIAGTSTPGFSGDGGQATSAQLDSPAGVAVDAPGNLYITDQGNLRIRKIDTNNVITTVAGTGTAGFSGDSGPAINAQFSLNVGGIAVSSDSTYLYIADFGNTVVRRVNLTTPTVQVTLASDTPGASFTVSGNGCGPAGTYNAPTTMTWVVNVNTTCSVTAIAPSGQPFSAWDGGSTANPRTFNAPASDSTYTAHFGTSSGTCSYVLSATSAGFAASAGDGSVNIAAPAGCAWTAMSNASWLTVTAGAQGTAGGTVSFHLDANSGSSSRTGTLTIGGQTMTVTQVGTSIMTPTALRFVPVAPCRIADTRDPNSPFGLLLTGQSTRDFAIPQSACGIPATAQAYSLNFTVVPTGKLGYLTVFPTGQPQPVTSTLNSLDGRVKANSAIVPAGANGAVSVFATDDTQLIIDINGYFVPASTASSLAFYPLAPCRLVDTRGAAGPLGAPSLSAQQERDFPVLTSSCQIPASARAYSLNYTVVPKVPLGYLTTWPAGQNRPTVSTLNSPTGAITANAAVVPAGVNGDLSVYVTHATDLVIDINGYFAPPANGGLSLYNMTPCRVYDSRTQVGAAPIVNSAAVNVAGSSCNAPSSAQSYVFNATVVPINSLQFLTLWPHGAGEQPNASTLNASDGAVMSNLAIVPTTDGSVNAFASASTHLILDIFGYFAP